MDYGHIIMLFCLALIFMLFFSHMHSCYQKMEYQKKYNSKKMKGGNNSEDETTTEYEGNSS